jgi:hypothetical protein
MSSFNIVSNPAAAVAVAILVVSCSTIILLVCYHRVLGRARKKAWEWVCTEDIWKQNNSTKRLFELPAIDSEMEPNHHMDMAHTPIYILKFLYLLIVDTPRFLLLRLLFSVFHQDITNEQVFGLVANTSLILVAELSKDGTELSIAIPRDTGLALPTMLRFSPCLEQIEGLLIVFDVHTKSIKQATGGNGEPVQHRGKEGSRNAQLMSMLNMFVSMCIHPTCHASSERSAKEIGENKVTALEPSSRFVFSLHQGLFHEKLAPLADNYAGITSSPGGLKTIRRNMKNNPVPPHNLDGRKAKISPFYDWLSQGHGIIHKLVKKHRLNVNAEYLFQNIVVHSVDHYSCYSALKCMEGRFGFNGSMSLKDLFCAYVYINFWLLPVLNPFESELVGKQSHPFYQELYEKMSKVNPDFAGKMLTSCSF